MKDSSPVISSHSFELVERSEREGIYRGPKAQPGNGVKSRYFVDVDGGDERVSSPAIEFAHASSSISHYYKQLHCWNPRLFIALCRCYPFILLLNANRFNEVEF